MSINNNKVEWKAIAIIMFIAFLFVSFLFFLNTKNINLSANLIVGEGELPKIGSQYGGGTVFYILKNGDNGYDPSKVKGLIAADNDILSRTWGSSLVSVGGTSALLGEGLNNTNKIIARLGDYQSGLYSPKVIADLSVGGYDDWYLPSVGESTLIYNQRDIIPNINSNGMYINALYWTSTEADTNNAYLYNYYYMAPGQLIADKSWVYEARPIRSFEITISEPIITSSEQLLGMQYNAYTVHDVRGITPPGWHIPTAQDFVDLTIAVGNESGRKLAVTRTYPGATTPSEIATEVFPYWKNSGTSNQYGLNTYNFNLFPGSYRMPNGIYTDLGIASSLWSSDVQFNQSSNHFEGIFYNRLYNAINLYVGLLPYSNNYGRSIRLVRNTNVGWKIGDKVLDYDGNEYGSVMIAGKVWTTEDLKVRHFNNGNDIPLVENAEQWANLGVSAMCYPYGNSSLVTPDFTSKTTGDKEITSFVFNNLSPTVTGELDQNNHTISLTVPYGTKLTALIPTISYSGVSIAPISGLAQNFTNPVEYTVTAEDNTTQKYTVTVSGSDTITGPDGLTYGTVVADDGRSWLDRNLGATRVATSLTDNLAIGDLYQWGRGADGHQIVTSKTSTNLSLEDNPGHGDFIINSSTPYDWRSPKNNNLWQGTDGGINNPCPVGFRLPTISEWSIFVSRETISHYNSAFNSSLRLPVSGWRNNVNGVSTRGQNGAYWSSTFDGNYSKMATFNLNSVGLGEGVNNFRATGGSIRCIMQQNVQPTPVISVPSGPIAFGTQITITSVGADAIYYDISEGYSYPPDTNDTLYESPITINSAVTLKAVAIRSGYANSQVARVDYYQASASNLTNLVLSGSPADYTFNPTTYNYTGVKVTHETESVTLTPTGSGTITVEGLSVISGKTSNPITLTPGVEKTITIIVSEPGKIPKTYTINLTRKDSTFAIGDYYEGGTIFYILQSGDYNYDVSKVRGFITANEDVTDQPLWSNVQNSFAGTDNTMTVGNGVFNTNYIIAQQGHTNSIAKYCADLVLNGYSDWFLPSHAEMEKFISNRALIPNSATSSQYWTSSEYSKDLLYNIMWNGGAAFQSKSATVLKFRPIRSFSVDLKVDKVIITSSNNGGLYTPQEVMLNTWTEGGQIRYTLDGTNPNGTSTLYNGKILIDQDLTIKARAYKNNYIASDITEKTFVVLSGDCDGDGQNNLNDVVIALINESKNLDPSSNVSKNCKRKGENILDREGVHLIWELYKYKYK